MSIVFCYFQLNFQFKKFATVSEYPYNSHSKPFSNQKLQCSFSYSFILSTSIYSLLFSVFPFLQFAYTPVITVFIVSFMFSVLSQICHHSHIANFLMVAFLVSVRFYILFCDVSPVVIFGWSFLSLLSGPYYFPLLLLTLSIRWPFKL
jgi:hypothetical protein